MSLSKLMKRILLIIRSNKKVRCPLCNGTAMKLPSASGRMHQCNKCKKIFYRL